MRELHINNSQQFTLNNSVSCHVDCPVDRVLIESELNGVFDDKACIITYLTKTGKVIFALSNYTRDLDIGISVLGFGNWCRKSIFNHLFSHIFDVLNCKRASVLVHPGNVKSIKLIKTIGFVHECDLRGMDLSQYSLLPEDTRYYERTFRTVRK